MISSNLFCMKKISNTKESVNAENWTSKKELMNICKCGKTTLEQIINDLNCPIDRAIQNHIKKGGYHNLETYYDDYLVKLIQAKILSNQANQGRSSQVVKQATKDNLELGVLANVALTNREAWEQFKALGDAKLEAEEKLKLEQQQNQKLQLENYQLNEENDYLKKLNDFNTTQLGYYTKKYHSWYDDYENY